MMFTSVSTNRWARLVSAAALLCVALLTAGCYKTTGGGWIPSFFGAGKANFGFSVMCKTAHQNGSTVAVIYDGQLEWQDGVVRLHGDVEPFVSDPGITCDDLRQVGGNTVVFAGTYKPQPSGASGTFSVQVFDNGEPGTINGDVIAIQLSGGQYSGYFNSGPIGGGNIQVF